MTADAWIQDLVNVAEAAAIDQLPRPLCISFTWTPTGEGQAHVTLVTDAEAARWEHAAAAELDAHGVGHGRAGLTLVRIVTAFDEYEQHVQSTPGMVRS